MSTIIKNGTVVTPSDTFNADVKIVDGTISAIAQCIAVTENDRVIDASGQYLFPGGIDPHAHLAINGTVDDFNSGTRAAAAGGITTVINFTDPDRHQPSFLENLNQWKQKAQSSLIDYSFHSIINRCDDGVLEEIARLPDEGVTSIKLFMAYRGSVMVNDQQMYRLMEAAARAGMVTNIHAENGDVIDELIHHAVRNGQTAPLYHAITRPAALEAEATSRALRIAEVLDAPVYIVHVTCEAAMNEVARAKKRGVRAWGETCPHYLVLDDTCLKKENREAVKYICSPPLRTPHDQQALWKGLAEGTLSTVGSDHASHPYHNGKLRGEFDFTKAPNGLPGIENGFSLLYHFGVAEGRLSLQQFVGATSHNAAKIFGLYPRKGALQVGSDADIVILDPARRWTIRQDKQWQRTEYNVYEGTELSGQITHVLSRGEVIVKENDIVGRSGRGQFVARSRYGAAESSG